MNIVQGVKKIVAVRPNAIGDFVFALPALRALRETYQDAEITLIGKQWHKDFLESRLSPIDRVIVPPPYFGMTSKNPKDADNKELQAFFAAMRREKFDIALQIYGGGRYSNPFTKALGAKLTVGLKAPDAEPLDRIIPYFFYRSEAQRYLEVMGLIGASTAHLQPELNVTANDNREAKNALQNVTRPYVAIHLSASDPRRRWPTRKFANVAQWLHQQGYAVVTVGSSEDKILGQRLLEHTATPVHNLIGKTSLGGLLGILQSARLMLANDSGPRHLAEAIGTPTVGIYWGPNLITSAPMSTLKHRTLSAWIMQCPVCKQSTFADKERCRHNVSFVSEVAVAKVKATIKELLESTAS